jgi:malonate decarboxylase epsilon subunit
MSLAFVFPGQGSQTPGMLHSLIDHPAVTRSLDEVSEAFGSDIRKLDTEESLRSDVAVQISLVTAGVATARALIEQGIHPIAVSGLSVGAFAAAVVAGVLPLQDAVRLVKLRAEQMMGLYPHSYGMSAIVGLSESQVASIVQAAHTQDNPVFVANINAPRQIVISGSNVAMDAVLAEALRSGAARAVRLHVSVPSHCPLLQPVADVLATHFAKVNLGAPRLIYVANINARAIRTKESIAFDLANNIAHGVRWYEATIVLKELGCSLFLEMPPGHVLTDLAIESLHGVQSLPVNAQEMPRVLRRSRQELEATR